MIAVLYPANETAFTTNGLGGLPDAISCTVTEQRNTQGGYWLEMDYPVDGLHYADIAPERIIYAAPSMGKTPQPFRIARINRPIDGIVHIEAPHISSDLQKITSYGTDTGADIEALVGNQLARASQLGQEVPFTFESDIVPNGSVTIGHPEPTSLASILLGSDGSVLDVCGGEFEFDGRTVILHQQRGVDSGLEIRYGVNMADINAETDATGLVTAVVPFWTGNVNGNDVTVIGDLCEADNADAYAYVRCVPLDVTDQFELEQDTQPTTAAVTAKGQAFLASTAMTSLAMSIDVAYTPTTLGIGDRIINLCDTVRVVHPDLGVSALAKVVETVYNVLTEQYETLTIGSIRKDIVDTIASMIGESSGKQNNSVGLPYSSLPPVYGATEGEIAAVAESYYSKRYFDGTTTFRFDYQTSTDRTAYGGDATYRTERFRLGMIDCSALAGLIIRGLDYDHSPYGLAYAAGGTMYQRIGSSVNGSVVVSADPPDFDPDSVRCNPAARWAINPRDFWCLGNYKTGHDEGDDDEDGSIPSTVPAQGRPQSAANLAQLLLTMGYVVPIDGGFSQIRKGDVLFWAGKIEEGEHAGEYRQPTRFLRIHHVAVCSEIIDGKHYYIDSVGDGDPIRKACLETDLPKAEYLILVIRLRQGNAWSRLRILSPPEDAIVAAGSVQRFNCIATGDQVRYRWQYSDDNGSTWNDSTLPHSSTVYPTISAGMDGRLYHCLCTDMHGRTATSRAALITIGSSPGQTVTPITNAEIDAICT